ncbi:MAG: peptidylprolyl isomerase [Candidatus Protistobacter heckmanni]|nr:peptidylprolyl isomerase [Candidatus Protistobacter heckmanni]
MNKQLVIRAASAVCAAAALLAAPAYAQNAALVNGKAIPKSALDNLIKRSGQPDNAELRERGRTMLIERELLIQEATKRGVLNREDVKDQIEQARTNVLVGALFEEYVKSHPPADSVLKAEYDKAMSQMGGKEYHALHILVEKEDDAKAIIAKLNAGGNFEELAKASSKDPGSAPNGGDLDWANPSNFVPEFSAAMTSLQKGQYIQTPVKTQFGFHIIKLDDVRDAKIPTFDQVKGEIAKKIQSDQNYQRTKFQEMVKSLRDKAKIQ